MKPFRKGWKIEEYSLNSDRLVLINPRRINKEIVYEILINEKFYGRMFVMKKQNCIELRKRFARRTLERFFDEKLI